MDERMRSVKMYYSWWQT